MGLVIVNLLYREWKIRMVMVNCQPLGPLKTRYGVRDTGNLSKS